MHTVAYLSIVLIAAILQAATGFGFAIIAIPFLLMLFDPHDAIQLNIILAVLITIFMIYKVRDGIDKGIVKRYILGSIFGIPPGIYLFLYLDVRPLKIFVSIIILVLTVLLVVKLKFKQSNIMEYFVGGFSGFLTASIGLPGPPLMLYFAGTNMEKQVVRGTTMAYFIFTCLVSFLMQLFTSTVSSTVWISTLYAIPILIIGSIAGQWLYHKINQQKLQIIIYISLFITGAFLLVSTI